MHVTPWEHRQCRGWAGSAAPRMRKSQDVLARFHFDAELGPILDALQGAPAGSGPPSGQIRQANLAWLRWEQECACRVLPRDRTAPVAQPPTTVFANQRNDDLAASIVDPEGDTP
jgi:hypothetical protein